jgi:N-acyl-D-aspartate/D-glutamate deacylase
MTGMPAQRMGLSNRGKIAENMMADLVIFNPETILDKGTFTDPHQYPQGIEYVLVNGVFAVERGEFTGKKAGKVLYGPGKK